MKPLGGPGRQAGHDEDEHQPGGRTATAGVNIISTEYTPKSGSPARSHDASLELRKPVPDPS